MKKITLAIALSSAVCLSQAYASAGLTLDELLREANPVARLKTEAQTDPTNAKNLCQEIKEPSFYDKASAAGLGPIKRNGLINYCSGVEFEKASLKQAVQKPKQEAVKMEMPKLRPVDLSERTNAEDERNALEAAREALIQNAIALGKQKEYQGRIDQAEGQLKQAQEHYDNLSVAVMVMREDLKAVRGFVHFNPNAHDDASPEAYLVALNAALPQESNGLLTQASLEQVRQATELLRQANENLAAARHDLEAINREMLELTQ